jgi:hypothetical protein
MLCVLCKIGCNGRVTVAIRSGENTDVRVKRGRTLATRVKQGVAWKKWRGIQRTERCITAGGVNTSRNAGSEFSNNVVQNCCQAGSHIDWWATAICRDHRPTLGVSSFAVEPVSVVNDRITY